MCIRIKQIELNTYYCHKGLGKSFFITDYEIWFQNSVTMAFSSQWINSTNRDYGLKKKQQPQQPVSFIVYFSLLHLSVPEGKNKWKWGHSYKIGQYFSVIPHAFTGSSGEHYETSPIAHLLDEPLSFLYLESVRV